MTALPLIQLPTHSPRGNTHVGLFNVKPELGKLSDQTDLYEEVPSGPRFLTPCLSETASSLWGLRQLADEKNETEGWGFFYSIRAQDRDELDMRSPPLGWPRPGWAVIVSHSIRMPIALPRQSPQWAEKQSSNGVVGCYSSWWSNGVSLLFPLSSFPYSFVQEEGHVTSAQVDMGFLVFQLWWCPAAPGSPLPL